MSDPSGSRAPAQREPGDGAPRWLKIVGLSLAVVVLLLLVMRLLPGGMSQHGSPDEAPSSDGSGATSDDDGTGGHVPPFGRHG